MTDFLINLTVFFKKFNSSVRIWQFLQLRLAIDLFPTVFRLFLIFLLVIVQRKQDLEDSLQAHQYYADANEAESWIKEKEPIVSSTDYGKDEDSSEALLKKHEALMSDLLAFGNTIEALKEQAQSCRVSKKLLKTIISYSFVSV